MNRRVKVEEKTEEYNGSQECSHYWIIEMANGPTSRGVCKYCGERRDFLNTIPDFNVPKRKSQASGVPDKADGDTDEDDES